MGNVCVSLQRSSRSRRPTDSSLCLIRTEQGSTKSDGGILRDQQRHSGMVNHNGCNSRSINPDAGLRTVLFNTFHGIHSMLYRVVYSACGMEISMSCILGTRMIFNLRETAVNQQISSTRNIIPLAGLGRS
ncbi:hypothetical protein CPC08DRAFT_729493 [Agrocybe pediades]|nr:hypothetical protein CPC08DRAFT_729493 [Agrocybe pediades]